MWEKITSPDIRVGFLAAANDLATKLAAGVLTPEKAAIAPQLIFNQRLDAALMLFFAALLWLIVFDTLRICVRHLRNKPVPPLSEEPYLPSQLEEAWVRD